MFIFSLHSQPDCEQVNNYFIQDAVKLLIHKVLLGIEDWPPLPSQYDFWLTCVGVFIN